MAVGLPTDSFVKALVTFAGATTQNQGGQDSYKLQLAMGSLPVCRLLMALQLLGLLEYRVRKLRIPVHRLEGNYIQFYTNNVPRESMQAQSYITMPKQI